MDADLFGKLGRRLGRRGVLGGAGVLAGLVFGGSSRAEHAAAQPAPPPPGDGWPWPPCSAERPDYCVAEFSVGGVDLLGGTWQAPYQLTALASSTRGPSGEANIVEWQVTRGGGRQDLTGIGPDEEVLVRLRTGRLRAGMTYSRSVGLRMAESGDADAGWELRIAGKAGLVPVIMDGDDTDWERADGEWMVFSGYTLDPAARSGGDGAYCCAAALDVQLPEWANNGWQIKVSSPHYASDGGVTRGSYSAWLPPASLERMGLTPEQALAGELLVTRIDGGGERPLAASVSPADGGVLIDVPELTFSSPTIRVAKKGGAKKKRKKGGKRRR